MATIVHFDISANNIERAKEFYGKLFNWQIEKLAGPVNYYLIKTTDLHGNVGIGGGMSERETGRGEGIINYIGVTSINATLEQVIALGGKVIQPAQFIPGYGELALCTDTEGNIFGVFEEVLETSVKHEIQEVNWPEKTFLTKREKLPFAKLSSFFKENYSKMYSFLGKAGITPGEMPCAFYYSIDESKNETDLAAAIPVPANVPDIQGFEKVILPASRLVTITHTGPYEAMATAYAALNGYVDGKHLKKGLTIEEYFSDPEVEKDPAKWKTKIYFQLK